MLRHKTKHLFTLLLLLFPAASYAGECKKTRTLLECTEVTIDELLEHYNDESSLTLTNVTWESSWNAARLAPVNTLSASNVKISEEALRDLITIPNSHLSLINISNSTLSLPSADFFNHQILDVLQLSKSVELLPKTLSIPYLQELDFSNNEFLELPLIKGERLTYLNVSGNKNIKNLSFLSELPSLEILDLSYCDLKSLETLPSMANLKKLLLEGNRLSSAHEINMPQLETLNLNLNFIASLDSNDFKGVKSLETLLLSDNIIVKMDNPFTNVPELKTLDLSVNELTSLDSNWFSSIPELEILQLKANALTELPTLSTPLNSLHAIYLNDNHLKNLNKEFFDQIPQLSILDVSNNELTDIDEVMPALSKLNKLYLRKNFLKVNKDTFGPATTLKYVDLSFNSLDISLDVFEKNLQLRSLTLSNNNIKNACPVTGLPQQIQYLDIKRNQLERIGCLKGLSALQISDNPLICDSELQKDIRHIIISHGQLNLPYIMRPAALGGRPSRYSSILDDSITSWVKAYNDICPDGPIVKDDPTSSSEGLSRRINLESDSDKAFISATGFNSSDDDDDDSDYSSSAESDEYSEARYLSMKNILNLKTSLVKYHTLQFWINAAYILLAVSIFVLILNVAVILHRRRRIGLTSITDSPYKKLHNGVYKDTTHLVDEKKSFPSVFFKDKLARLGVHRNATPNTDLTDSQAKMIPDSNVV